MSDEEFRTTEEPSAIDSHSDAHSDDDHPEVPYARLDSDDDERSLDRRERRGEERPTNAPPLQRPSPTRDRRSTPRRRRPISFPAHPAASREPGDGDGTPPRRAPPRIGFSAMVVREVQGFVPLLRQPAAPPRRAQSHRGRSSREAFARDARTVGGVLGRARPRSAREVVGFRQTGGSRRASPGGISIETGDDVRLHLGFVRRRVREIPRRRRDSSSRGGR